MNITLVGFMGTGKTSVGKRLAKQLGWRFVDIDALVETSAKKSIPRIFEEHGGPVFRRLEERMIRRAVRNDAQVIAAGGGAFVSPENQRRLRATGPVICLTASPKTILQRVSRTLSSRPLLMGGSTLVRIQTLLQQRAPAYAKADLTIDTTNLEIEEVADRVWEQIGPWISKSWDYLLKHCPQLSQRYGGQYVVVLEDRIVAAGPTQLKAYQNLHRPVPANREVGIYYIPLPEESAVAL